MKYKLLITSNLKSDAVANNTPVCGWQACCKPLKPNIKELTLHTLIRAAQSWPSLCNKPNITPTTPQYEKRNHHYPGF
jgi:hypothetical protein